jgi:hypothetical protein
MNENEPEKLFADYIRQIEAEDRLIGVRVQWTLTFQGFLFASFGLSAQQSSSGLATKFLTAAPVLGVVTAALGFVGALAAQLAANRKRSQWLLTSLQADTATTTAKRPWFTSNDLQWHISAAATLGFPASIIAFWAWIIVGKLH